jgi:hypothetical protein
MKQSEEYRCMQVMHKENKKGLEMFRTLMQKTKGDPDRKSILINAKYDYLQNLPDKVFISCRLIFNNEKNLIFCTLIDKQLSYYPISITPILPHDSPS